MTRTSIVALPCFRAFQAWVDCCEAGWDDEVAEHHAADIEGGVGREWAQSCYGRETRAFLARSRVIEVEMTVNRLVDGFCLAIAFSIPTLLNILESEICSAALFKTVVRKLSEARRPVFFCYCPTS
jgi:hypothetical protein